MPFWSSSSKKKKSRKSHRGGSSSSAAAPSFPQLYVLQFEQNPNLPTSFYHWGLYFAFTDRGTGGPGVLFHSVYSGNETSSEVARQSALALGQDYNYGYRMDQKPRGTSTNIVNRVPVTLLAATSVEEIDEIASWINNVYPYNAISENCQRFTYRILRELHYRGKVTREEITRVHQHLPGNWFDGWDNPSSESEDSGLAYGDGGDGGDNGEGYPPEGDAGDGTEQPLSLRGGGAPGAMGRLGMMLPRISMKPRMPRMPAPFSQRQGAMRGATANPALQPRRNLVTRRAAPLGGVSVAPQLSPAARAHLQRHGVKTTMPTMRPMNSGSGIPGRQGAGSPVPSNRMAAPPGLHSMAPHPGTKGSMRTPPVF